MNSDNVLLFYGWWQLVVCLLAFLGLMSVWWHLGRRQGDTGQVWLALSILCWAVSGGIELLFVYWPPNDNGQLYLDGFRSMLSLLNSLFILISLPWFRYIPKPIAPLIKSSFWRIVVGLPFLFSLLPTVSRMVSGNQSTFITELDVYYSILTLLFLGYVFWETFEKRRLKLLGWLALITVLITFFAQLYKMTGHQVNTILFSAIFKTSLIMLFFAMAISWVKDLMSALIPSSPDQIFLHLVRRRETGNKIEHLLYLKGIPGKEHPIPLTNSAFQLLHLFIEKKKNGAGWLEIKPKQDSREGLSYDINDHNEIKRLVKGILDGLFGKQQWTKDQHENPLKQVLFESSQEGTRKVRLAIPSENMLVDM